MSEGRGLGDHVWRRRLAEAVVIVASILLAFAIDAAWDARQDRERRDALLAALDREMALSAVERDRVAGYHAAGQEATAALLMIDVGAPPRPSSARAVDSLLQAAYNNTATFDAPSGALDGLLASGSLDLVDDEVLLGELTSYPGFLDNLTREQGTLVETGLRLLDYLGAAGVDLSLLNEAAYDTALEVPWELGLTTAYTLVGEPHFRSLLNELYWRYANCLQNLEAMQQSIERIRALSEQGGHR